MKLGESSKTDILSFQLAIVKHFSYHFRNEGTGGCTLVPFISSSIRFWVSDLHAI